MDTTTKIRQLERNGNLEKFKNFVCNCEELGISLTPWRKRLTTLRCSFLNREECVQLLENVGIQCYDDESLSVLQRAVKENVLDGTITL